MKKWPLTLLWLCALIAPLSALTVRVIPPAERIKLSMMSGRIEVIECTAFEWEKPVEEDGLEIRQWTVKGKILEVLRGDKKVGEEFTHTDTDWEIVDPTKKTAKEFAMLGDGKRSKDIGAIDCKPGQRYLVIHALDTVWFIHVRKKDETWREEILDLHPDFAE